MASETSTPQQTTTTDKPAPPPTNGTALATKAAAATVEIAKTGQIIRVGFDTMQGFEALQRIGRAFAASSLVPESYRGQGNLANCIIAVEMAARIGASPLMVMQNLYIVNGRPAWSAQFLISAFNSCGRFSAIRYRFTGEKGKDSWGCLAYSREKGTDETVEGPEVTIAMAKEEGWHGKKGSKWQTIPQLMLTYRAATFLIRTTAPELTMGLRTADEIEDIGEPEFQAPPPATPLPEAAADAAAPIAAGPDQLAEARAALAQAAEVAAKAEKEAPHA